MRARKRFGQHFLHDPAVIERIVAAIAPRAGDTLVEIGPGRGALTLPLLQRGLTVDAIEIDRDLPPLLCAAAKGLAGTLRLHRADALTFDYARLAVAGTRLRLVGNLPYNIATELLFRLLAFAPAIADMHFMVQQEVAQRLQAPPGGKARGRLSLMIQAWCEVELLFSVGPGAFTPPPAVDSAVVRLVPRPGPALGESTAQDYGEVVREAFSQRRKTLRNTLRRCLPEAAIRAAGIDPGRRAETLDNAEFAALAEALTQHRRGTS